MYCPAGDTLCTALTAIVHKADTCYPHTTDTTPTHPDTCRNSDICPNMSCTGRLRFCRSAEIRVPVVCAHVLAAAPRCPCRVLAVSLHPGRNVLAHVLLRRRTCPGRTSLRHRTVLDMSLRHPACPCACPRACPTRVPTHVPRMSHACPPHVRAVSPQRAEPEVSASLYIYLVAEPLRVANL